MTRYVCLEIYVSRVSDRLDIVSSISIERATKIVVRLHKQTREIVWSIPKPRERVFAEFELDELDLLSMLLHYKFIYIFLYLS